MSELIVRSTVIDWPAEVLEITDITNKKHTVPLSTSIQVTMVGFPAREEKIMPARELGEYMSRGYIIEKISFDEEKKTKEQQSSGEHNPLPIY